MKRGIKKIVAFMCAVAMLFTTIFAGNEMNQAKASAASQEAISASPDATFDRVTFGHLSISDGTYTCADAQEQHVAKGTLIDGVGFDKSVFCGEVKFTGGSDNFQLIVGASEPGGWNGLHLIVRPTDVHELMWFDGTSSIWNKSVTDELAQTSLYNEVVRLMISMEKVGADVKLGVWFNEVLYNQQYFTISGGASSLGNSFSAFVNDVGASVSLTSAETALEQPNEEFEKITFGHLGISNGTYYGQSEDNSGSLEAGESLDKKVLCGTIQMSETKDNHQLNIGSNGAQAWHGLRWVVQKQNDGTYQGDLHWYDNTTVPIKSDAIGTLYPSIAGVDFVGDSFDLMVSLEIVGEDIKVGFWFDGVLYNQKYFTITGQAAKLGTYVNLYTVSDTPTSITVNSVPELMQPDESFEKITFGHFGIADGTYKGQSEDNSGSLEAGESLDKKVLCGTIQMSETKDNHQLNIGSNGAQAWHGLRWVVQNQGDGTYQGSLLWFNNGAPSDVSYTLDPSIAGVDFVGDSFDLMVSLEKVGTDIKVGFWFDGVLYNQKYFTIIGQAANLGTYVNLYSQDSDTSITVNSVPELMQPNEDFEKITFGHFGIVDGIYYGKGTENSGSLEAGESLDKKVLCGTIQMSETDANHQLNIGSNGAQAWHGLRWVVEKQGDTYQGDLHWFDSNDSSKHYVIDTLYPSIAGVDFVGDSFDLMVSLEKVGDDIKVGFWFDGVLYNQKYFTIKGQAAKLGTYVNLYSERDNTPITVNSVPELLIQPDDSFDKVTFGHFNVSDGTYAGETIENARGTIINKESLDKTAVCGEVNLSPAGEGNIQLIFGEENGGFNGLHYMVDADGNACIFMYDPTKTSDKSSEYKNFDLKKAGVKSFINTPYELMISMEIIDGTTNVKVGVWFDGFLYDGKFFVFEDYAAVVKSDFRVACYGEPCTFELNATPELFVKSDNGFRKVTFSEFGIEDNIWTDGTVTGEAKNYKTLDKVMFTGDMRLESAGAFQLCVGGLQDATHGLRLALNNDGTLTASWVNAAGEQAKVGTFAPALNETFNLKVSMEVVDVDKNFYPDIRIGIWFDDVFYTYNTDQYLIVENLGGELGNLFRAESSEGTSFMFRGIHKLDANPYYYEDISEYFNHKQAPTSPEGYVFGGWYHDEDYTEPITTKDSPKGAYAKFVDKKVLSVKSQVLVDKDTKKLGDNTTLRLITSVDTLQYTRIGFRVAKQKDDGTYGKVLDTSQSSPEDAKMVYRKLYAVGSNEEIITYLPTAFSYMSNYFKAFSVTNIVNDAEGKNYNTKFRVVPYWITRDGTEVTGDIREICVNDYDYRMVTENESQAVSLDFVGEGVMPIGGNFGPYPLPNTYDNTLPDYNTEWYFKAIADAGLNSMVYSQTDYATNKELVMKQLEFGEKYGIGIYVWDSNILGDTITSAETLQTYLESTEYYDKKAFCGMYLVDEPYSQGIINKMDGLSGNLTEEKKAELEAKLISVYEDVASYMTELKIQFYCNLNPIYVFGPEDYDEYSRSFLPTSEWTIYKNYLSEANEDLNASVISYDNYPFLEAWRDTDKAGTNAEFDVRLYLENMDAVRTVAQDAEKPFWTVIQAGAHWNDKGRYFTTSEYYPNQNQFNWNVNTSLAFGAQGIQYFPLVQPEKFAFGADESDWDFERNGILGAWGNKTQWYYYAQDINKHIKAIDDVLMQSKNLGVIVNGEQATSDMAQVTDSKISSSNHATYGLKNITGDTMIGCFDYCGRTALYVVNYNYTEGSSQDITLTFTESKSVKCIRKAQVSESTGSSITLNMDGGEGVLLVIE